MAATLTRSFLRPLRQQQKNIVSLTVRAPVALQNVRFNSYYAGEEEKKTTLLIETTDGPGSLQEALKYFWKRDVNMTHIESRPSKKFGYKFMVDFEGSPSDENVAGLINDLQRQCSTVMIMGEREVPWFATKKADLDKVARHVLGAGTDLESDHPGFNDVEYRKRREELACIAETYEIGSPIPRIQYTDTEIQTWRTVWEKLRPLTEKFACKEYNYILPLMEANCGYAADNIPQVEDISAFLKDCTGFQLRPVGGLLSSRNFLNGLAFRVFFSTQYIRHHSVPLYTPEPDICHELMGHAPMLADPDFADFSQEIGLASLGASDEEIKKLATCYWFSVEFGLCRQDGDLKAYGAGLLSSFGELEYACLPTRPGGGRDEFPEYRPWNPAEVEYPITTYQPTYFVAESLADAKEKMRAYCEGMDKPFHAIYDPLRDSVKIDRNVKLSAPDKDKEHVQQAA